MTMHLGPDGLSVQRVTETEQYPQGNDLDIAVAKLLAGGESVGGHPQDGATEEAHVEPLSLISAPLRPPEYTLRQLSQSSGFMAPNHPPTLGPVDGCTCRDCRWYRLGESSIASNLDGLAHLKELRRIGKITPEQYAQGEKVLFWWIPF